MATIGEAEAKQIAACEQAEGRCLMAEIMDFGPYTEERNLQKSIQVDFFYDHLMFAVNKGFPWEKVCSVVQFADEFLATATDKTITEAVRLYKAQSPNLLLELGEENYKTYTDFLFSTFFTHFQLYKYMMTYPRKEHIPQVNLDVHPPVPPLPLKDSKEVNVWRYEKTVESMENREFELLKERLVHQEQVNEEINNKKNAVTSKVETTDTPFTKDMLGEMMRSVLADYAAATTKGISAKIQDTQKDLEVKLAKTSLPRPAVLGPPPRFKPKSPIQLLPKVTVTGSKGADKKNKNNNSLTPGGDKPKSPKSPKSSARSRGSSRGSRR